MVLRSLLVALSLLVKAALCSNVYRVLELKDDAAFSATVGGERSVMMAFVAPWCGHCKAISGAWNQTAEVFAGSDVALARLDAEANRRTAERYGIRGYPTLRYFHHGSTKGEEYIGGRTTDALIEFLNKRNGLQRALREPPSLLPHLKQDSFDALVGGDTAAFVMFYAPWCPHSKALMPIYEQVSRAFEHEAGLVVARVDATREVSLMKGEGISAYPTVKFYSRGSTAGVAYDKVRSVGVMVDYLNNEAGTSRDVTGILNTKAGRIKTVDDLVAGFVSKSDAARNEITAKVIELVKGVCNGECGEKTPAQYYVEVVRRVLDNGPGHIETEAKRLQGLINGGHGSPQNRDRMVVKRNILTAFQ